MNYYFISICGIILGCFSPTQAQKVIRLYEGKAPGSETWTWTQNESTQNAFKLHLLYNVTTPTLTVYLPKPEVATGTAVIIAPGGAFQILSIDNEGIDVAKWLTAKGITAFVLTYRLVKSQTNNPVDELIPLLGNFEKLNEKIAPIVPLAIADGKQAIDYVRRHASQYQVAPHQIGLLGFSAGGTLAIGVGYSYVPENRPDFLATIYPYSGGLASKLVPVDAPPLFIALASDDQLNLAPYSVALYNQWLSANKSVEMHAYVKGGHGFGMRRQKTPTDTWMNRFEDWLGFQGYLRKRHP